MTQSNDFPSLLPTAMRIASSTISKDLIFASDEEIDQVKDRLKKENRSNKLNSILNNIEYVEKKLEDDEEYQQLMKKGIHPMGAPKGEIFFLDYNYGTCIS